MRYKVNKLYSRGSDIPIAEFSEITDAKLFINQKLYADANLKLNITYRLLEFTELLEEFNQDKGESGSFSGSGGGPSQARSSGQTFSPTPFNNAPRPPGMPHNWIKDDDKKK